MSERAASHAELSHDAKGKLCLGLRGDWSTEMEHALSTETWEVLTLFGVTWPSYEPLAPFADKIEWLRVPFGPDSSRGLERLTRLRVLQLTDAPKPWPDFRALPRLEELEMLWGPKRAEQVAHPKLKTLYIHGVSGADLTWIAGAYDLRRLRLQGGSLVSLAGIAALGSLEELRVEELKRCADAAEVAGLTQLRVLELDAGKAPPFDSLDWLEKMPQLSRLLLGPGVNRLDWSQIGRHPGLKSVSLDAPDGYGASDEAIRRELVAADRQVLSIRRFEGRKLGFAVEMA